MQFADTRLQFTRGCCRFCLIPERFQLVAELGSQVVQAGQISAHGLKFAGGFILAAAVF